MLFIVNRIISDEAVNRLNQFGEVILFSTSGIVDNYLSGHVDLFFTKIGDRLIYAPNTLEKYINELKRAGVKLEMGKKSVGGDYPDCAIYNAAISGGVVVHKFGITDEVIKLYTQKYLTINVKQGMTRCSTLILNNNAVITSDKGIEKECVSKGIDTLFVTPEDIKLPGKPYGLFGGCCGVHGDKIFINGSLSKKSGGNIIQTFLDKYNMEIIELDDTPLTDIGSIICL